MPSAIVTILGGLQVWAEVWFSKDYYGECDAGVDSLHWIKRRKGRAPAKGNEVSQKVYDRLDKDPYWQADVTEQASEILAAEYYDAQERKAEERRDELLFD